MRPLSTAKQKIWRVASQSGGPRRHRLRRMENAATPPAAAKRRSPLSTKGDSDAADAGGYINVAVRVRPLGQGRGTGTSCLSIDTFNGSIGTGKGKESFCFSSVFQECNNEELNDRIGTPLVRSALIGVNGTLMAYGQTGCGKTYTIGEIAKLGSEHEGVSHRMVRYLYDKIEHSSAGRVHEVSVMIVQIYCEKIYDCLSDTGPKAGGTATPLALREDTTLGVQVQGAVTKTAATAEEAFALLRKGASRIAVAATNMNAQSSRSHCVVQLSIVSRPATEQPKRRPSVQKRPMQANLLRALSQATLEEGDSPKSEVLTNYVRKRSLNVKAAAEALKTATITEDSVSAIVDSATSNAQVTTGKLSIVDLAGSEDVGRSGATGTKLAEAKKINTSLLALGNVIHALTCVTKI